MEKLRMENLDLDLQSVQEVRLLIKRAKEAQATLSKMNQEEIDKIVDAIAQAGYDNREKLAKMANEETGFGIWQDKVVKNTFGSKVIYDYIKDMKTVGIIGEDRNLKTMDVAVPVGLIAGLIPSTNPTSTVMFKTLISIKSGNAIVFSPHPSAKNCILETVKILNEAAVKAGAPEGLISSMTMPTLEATNELMTNEATSLILATGGSAMVKAAYSSGNPAIGVGPGNSPAYIEKSANVKDAVKRIMDSKTFDNGTICASEQSIIVEKANEEEVRKYLVESGAYFLNEIEKKKLESFILRANGSMNPQIVGKSVEVIAELSGLTIPAGVKLLVAEETKVGKDHAYSREKLAPIIAFYVVKDSREAKELSIRILENEGIGHTYNIHSNDEEIIREFGMDIPVSRFLINTPGALGGIGGSTNLIPSLTLGCGSIGGSSTADNIGPMHLLDIKKIAYGVREIEDLR